MIRSLYSKIRFQNLAVTLLDNRLSYKKRNIVVQDKHNAVYLIYQISLYPMETLENDIFAARLRSCFYKHKIITPSLNLLLNRLAEEKTVTSDDIAFNLELMRLNVDADSRTYFSEELTYLRIIERIYFSEELTYLRIINTCYAISVLSTGVPIIVVDPFLPLIDKKMMCC
jgi:hypothetical protein